MRLRQGVLCFSGLLVYSFVILHHPTYFNVYIVLVSRVYSLLILWERLGFSLAFCYAIYILDSCEYKYTHTHTYMLTHPYSYLCIWRYTHLPLKQVSHLLCAAGISLLVPVLCGSLPYILCPGSALSQWSYLQISTEIPTWLNPFHFWLWSLLHLKTFQYCTTHVDIPSLMVLIRWPKSHTAKNANQKLIFCP